LTTEFILAIKKCCAAHKVFIDKYFEPVIGIKTCLERIINLEQIINEILEALRKHGSEKNRTGMARFGITTDKAFGVNIPVIRNIAKVYKNEHEIALALWDTGFHEARLLAVFIDNPKLVTKEQANKWVAGFNSWDICDQCCGNLFDKLPFANKLALEWIKDEREYVRRAGFVVFTAQAVHDKKAPNKLFIDFLPYLEKYATDERNFVRKAVNWSLRQIGKRNTTLRIQALECAERISQINSKAARWIAADAIRELNNEKTISRIKIG